MVRLVLVPQIMVSFTICYIFNHHGESMGLVKSSYGGILAKIRTMQLENLHTKLTHLQLCEHCEQLCANAAQCVALHSAAKKFDIHKIYISLLHF